MHRHKSKEFSLYFGQILKYKHVFFFPEYKKWKYLIVKELWHIENQFSLVVASSLTLELISFLGFTFLPANDP